MAACRMIWVACQFISYKGYIFYVWHSIIYAYNWDKMPMFMLIRININVNLCYRSSVTNFLILFEWYSFNSTGNRTYTITSFRFIDIAYSLSHMQPQVYTDEDLIFWEVDLSTQNTHNFAQFDPFGRQLWVIKLCLSKYNQSVLGII